MTVSVTATFATFTMSDETTVEKQQIVVVSSSDIEAEAGKAVDDNYGGTIEFNFTMNYTTTNSVVSNYALFHFKLDASERLGIGNSWYASEWGTFHEEGPGGGGNTAGVPVVANVPVTFNLVIEYVVGGLDTATLNGGGFTNHVMTGNYAFNHIDVRNGNVGNTVEFTGMSMTATAAPPSPPVWDDPLVVSEGIMGDIYADTLADKVTDNNGDTITFTKESGASWLSVASTGELAGIPSILGTNEFSVTATAGGDSSTATLYIVVRNTEPPVWDVDPINETAIAGQAFSGTLAGNASDPDGNEIIYAMVSGPSWLTVASDGALAGTAPFSTGTNTFIVSASDRRDPPTQATLNIMVKEPLTGILQSDPELTTASGGGADLVRIDESNDSDDWITSVNSSGGTIYIGFDWTVTNNAGETGGGGFYGGLELYEGGAERLLIGNDWSSTNYALGGPGFSEVSSISYEVGTPVRLVCKLEMVVDGNDSASLFVNQESEGTPDASLSRNYNFTRLVHRTGNNSGESNLENLIIATTYADAYGGAGNDPVPVTDLVIQGPISAGTEIVLVWTAEDGSTYGVQTNVDLVSGNWLPLASGLEVIGGGTLTYTNTIGSDKTFYQVISE